MVIYTMIDLDKFVYNKWELPVEQALRVEALSHNMHLVQTEKSLREMLTDILGDEDTVLTIMAKTPFMEVEDKRFQISITYWHHKPIWEIESRGLEGDEKTLFNERCYWNWYPTKEDAIRKYKEKLDLLIDDTFSYADLSCMDVKLVRIRLEDTAYNQVLKEKYFRV